MNRIRGRNIYIVSLSAAVAGAGGTEGFADRCRRAGFSGIWIRLGYGSRLDPNLKYKEFSNMQSRLTAAGIDIWGWHIPRCADRAAASNEAQLVGQWASKYSLSGVLLDAEQGSAYFQGGRAEAGEYAGRVAEQLAKDGRGLALSSHDQPHYFPGFPFDVFLGAVQDNCPQVYYGSNNASARLASSMLDYQPLEVGRNFTDRYKPVGNITTHGDMAIADPKACLQQAAEFMTQVASHGFSGYGFWCWDEAPSEIWDFFANSNGNTIGS